MPAANPRKLLIVDGHAYAYRAFHAIRHLASPSGAPTNAIYGFIKMLGKMTGQLQPSHLAVVWDGGLSVERTSEHPAYKAQRPAMPDDLEKQLGGITEYLEAAGLASFCREGVEADDWIAALAGQFAGQLQVIIASSDKDFMQLVSANVGLLNPNDKVEKVWTVDDVKAKAGVEPGQIVDWLSLVGDAVDNIPGVPGVGPKTASDLLQRFGSIDGLYARLAEVKSDKLRASLQLSGEIVRRNQRLIRLRDEQAPVVLETIALREPAVDRLRVLYGDWGFKTMLAQLEGSNPTQQHLL